MALLEKNRLMQREFDDLCSTLASSCNAVEPETLDKELQKAVTAARSPA